MSALANHAFGPLHIGEPFCRAEIAVAHLVGGVDDIHRVGVGDLFQIPERDHPVFVHRAQPIGDDTHAVQSHQPDGQGKTEQNGDQQV